MKSVLEFLKCTTPDAWVRAAVREIETLMLDHASLELKAAQQAQSLVWRYALTADAGVTGLQPEVRFRLLSSLSRLAREELRHFEQVIGILEQRDTAYVPISASRYARALHAQARTREPGKIVDTLIVCAIIEARSCERLACLQSALDACEPALAKFYRSLLKSEARHFADYLELAVAVGGADARARADALLDYEAGLIESPDDELRFHSGVPA